MTEEGEEDIVGSGQTDEDSTQRVADLAVCRDYRLELLQKDGGKKWGWH